MAFSFTRHTVWGYQREGFLYCIFLMPKSAFHGIYRFWIVLETVFCNRNEFRKTFPLWWLLTSLLKFYSTRKNLMLSFFIYFRCSFTFNSIFINLKYTFKIKRLLKSPVHLIDLNSTEIEPKQSKKKIYVLMLKSIYTTEWHTINKYFWKMYFKRILNYVFKLWSWNLQVR